MFCTKCGSSNPAAESFCYNCGAALFKAIEITTPIESTIKTTSSVEYPEGQVGSIKDVEGYVVRNGSALHDFAQWFFSMRTSGESCTLKFDDQQMTCKFFLSFSSPKYYPYTKMSFVGIGKYLNFLVFPASCLEVRMNDGTIQKYTFNYGGTGSKKEVEMDAILTYLKSRNVSSDPLTAHTNNSNGKQKGHVFLLVGFLSLFFPFAIWYFISRKWK